MKYLYLIIRHFFPKKPISIWEEVKEIRVMKRGQIAHHKTIIVSKDQFGNFKQFHIEA